MSRGRRRLSVGLDSPLRSVHIDRLRSRPRIRPSLEWMEVRTLLSTFTVMNTDDSGTGSLRQAILDSNAATGQANSIEFAIPGEGVQMIAPGSPLPAITHAVLIDGWSQPGFASMPIIELDGSQAGGGDGLTITGSGVIVRGLDINNFAAYPGAGIHITGIGATGNWIYGNFLGTDPAGTEARPNGTGVLIESGAGANRIGTNGDGIGDAAERNLVSGNGWGIGISGYDAEGNAVGADGNVVAGNFVGTDRTGRSALGNQGGGIFLVDASSNQIGVNPHGGPTIAE